MVPLQADEETLAFGHIQLEEGLDGADFTEDGDDV